MAVRVRLPEAGFRRGTRGKLAEGVAGLGVSTVRVVMGEAFGNWGAGRDERDGVAVGDGFGWRWMEVGILKSGRDRGGEKKPAARDDGRG
ncbi:hypothetical protein A6X21_04950 [Planctopirus hydrillae]|uniref:Uncharacterized protein n=1 Tax=Planctopirus hydrillae TaxID=1841610 RepID=A0A1C3EIQ4_9PLAN|nr:hypothetical protein A6X21_04950 [Planctopirus hydrillae]